MKRILQNCCYLILSVCMSSMLACSNMTTTSNSAASPVLSKTVMSGGASKFQLVRTGENLRIILPAKELFFPLSPRIEPSAYATLDEMVGILNSYETVSIKIAGYTDNDGWQARNVSLSIMRARNVANYLWQEGVNTRMIYAEGYGDLDPIASNSSESGRDKNQRIEIIARLSCWS